MKKWICVLLTLCMVLTLAACGEKATPSGDNKGDATAENVEVKLLKSSDHRLNDDNAVAELKNSLAEFVNI